MSVLRILADESLPHLEALFGPLGRLACFRGPAPPREALAGADALVVRAATRVGRAMLDGTPVRFVGSATAGTDHLALEELAAAGIATAHSPGSNAEAVAEHVVTALAGLAVRRGETLEGRRLGVIGRGAVGRRVAAHAKALGLIVAANDPPLEEAGERGLVPLESALAADWVTLHVPLAEGGRHPTRGLVHRGRLARMGGGLVNTSRGEVVDEEALLALSTSPLVLDVWGGEPEPRPDLVRRADLATPHVAGHSLDGKAGMVRGVQEALCAWLGRTVPPLEAPLVEEPPDPRILPPGPLPATEPQPPTEEAWLAHALASAYDLAGEARRFAGAYLAEGRPAWERLRHTRAPRWEWRHWRIERREAWPARVLERLAALGFQT